MLLSIARWLADAGHAAVKVAVRAWTRHRLRPERLFAVMTDRRTLAVAWRKVRRTVGPASREPDMARFATFTSLRLRCLSRALRNGSYEPGPLRRLSVSKPDGSRRHLAIPAVADRVAQTAAAATLGAFLDAGFSGASFAYRPGRSVAQAVQLLRHHARQGHVWLVDGDIRAFFDEIPHALLLERLGARVPDPRIRALVERWLTGFSSARRGLPQGSPMSPLLSNLFLDAFDRRVEQWPEGRWVRYADDFILLCRDRATAFRLRLRLQDELALHGLKLNAFKTRVTSFHDGFIFLGHAFRGESLAAVPRRAASRNAAA